VLKTESDVESFARKMGLLQDSLFYWVLKPLDNAVERREAENSVIRSRFNFSDYKPADGLFADEKARPDIQVNVMHGDGGFVKMHVDGKEYAFIANHDKKTISMLGAFVSGAEVVGIRTTEPWWANADLGQIGVAHRHEYGREGHGTKSKSEFFVLNREEAHRNFSETANGTICRYEVIAPISESDAASIGETIRKMVNFPNLFQGYSLSSPIVVKKQ
jgi:hypothetical protein